MTVVLVGIGADTTNLGVLAPLYDDGGFEYIPIPEKTRQTTESTTFGSWPLRGRDGVAADVTSRIRPQPIHDDSIVISGSDVSEWPIHHDPNFDALTYGEHRNGYVTKLRELEAGDVVGFYAGLRPDSGGRAHRYLIGYFTVDDVALLTPNLPNADRRSLLESHAENAHAKRASDGELYLDDKPVVIVDGTSPGRLFDRSPLRLSTYEIADGNERPQYYLRDAIEEAFTVVEGRRNMMFKPAYRCAIDGDRFISLIDEPVDRSALSAGTIDQSE